MMSGVRGSPPGGGPGRLNIGAIADPERISPIPAILLPSGSGGEVLSSVATAEAVWLESQAKAARRHLPSVRFDRHSAPRTPEAANPESWQGACRYFFWPCRSRAFIAR